MIKRRIENGRDVFYSVDCNNDKKIPDVLLDGVSANIFFHI